MGSQRQQTIHTPPAARQRHRHMLGGRLLPALLAAALCSTAMAEEDAAPAAQESGSDIAVTATDAQADVPRTTAETEGAAEEGDPDTREAHAQDPMVPEASSVAGAEPASAASAPGAVGAPLSTPAPGQSIDDMVARSDNDLLEMELQINAGEYDLPKAWLTARVDKIERNSHRFDPRLIRPLTLLGDIASREGNYEGALEHYGQAVHLQRVNDGLVSPGQVEIVHREADVYRNLGDLKNANEREEYAYYVLRRAFKPYDVNLLPGLYRLAEWYSQTNNVFSARALYQHSVDILTANGRGNSPEAIPALEGIAQSYRLERFPPYYVGSEGGSYGPGLATNSQFDVPISVGSFPQGEQALQRIVQIHRENGADPAEISASVLNLADWYLLFEKPRRSDPLYEYVYDLMHADESMDPVAFFAEPTLLHYPAPADPAPPPLGTSSEPRTGYVEVSYEITPTGFVRSLQTIDSDPKGMMDFRVRKSVRASRHRPVLVDGVPVKSTRQTFRHEFVYYPTAEDLTDERQARAEVIQ